MALDQRTKMFEAGMAATIEVNGKADSYPTRIEDLKTDYLVVATPMKQREYIALEPGKRVMLIVMRRNNPYFFDTHVVGSEYSDGQQYTQLRRPAENAGVQLRQHVRVGVTISDAQFWVEDENGKFGPTIPGQVLDISVGGIQAMTKIGLPVGAQVLSRFTLSRQAGSLMSTIQVLNNVERVSDVGVKSHRSGCTFVDLTEKDQDRLIKFVFQRERELRQKGAL